MPSPNKHDKTLVTAEAVSQLVGALDASSRHRGSVYAGSAPNNVGEALGVVCVAGGVGMLAILCALVVEDVSELPLHEAVGAGVVRRVQNVKLGCNSSHADTVQCLAQLALGNILR